MFVYHSRIMYARPFDRSAASVSPNVTITSIGCMLSSSTSSRLTPKCKVPSVGEDSAVYALVSPPTLDKYTF